MVCVPSAVTEAGAGHWSRHVVEGCFRVWDLAKPVIAQVHGWCLAGGSELATACDLVYVAEDAQIGERRGAACDFTADRLRSLSSP